MLVKQVRPLLDPGSVVGVWWSRDCGLLEVVDVDAVLSSLPNCEFIGDDGGAGSLLNVELEFLLDRKPAPMGDKGGFSAGASGNACIWA